MGVRLSSGVDSTKAWNAGGALGDQEESDWESA